MRHCVPMFVGFALALAGAAAHATDWLCNVSDDLVTLVCVADGDPREGVDAAITPTAMVRGQRYPLNPSLEYRIPLWTPPSDPDFVAELARASMCLRTPQCTVLLVPGAWAWGGRAPGAAARAPRQR